MTLLDPGAEPRTLLRYHLTAGQTETLEMVLTVSMTTKYDSQERAGDAPAMRMAASIAITAVGDDGTADVEMPLTELDWSILMQPASCALVVGRLLGGHARDVAVDR